jgi:hypothetical protein
MHIAGGDRADFLPLKSQGERKVQQSARRGLPQGMKARLTLAVLHIWGKHERYVEEDLLNFSLANLVFVFALAVVAASPSNPSIAAKSIIPVYFHSIQHVTTNESKVQASLSGLMLCR